jgi:membrane-associated phospholipid phosphatase
MVADAGFLGEPFAARRLEDLRRGEALVEQRTRLPVDRRLAFGALACALVTCVIGLYYTGDSGPRAFDTSIKNVLDAHLADHRELLRFLVLSTQPYVLLPVIVLIVTVCAIGGRRQDAVLAALGPAVAVSANTWVLKPLFDRQNEGLLAYPSGHTVSLVSTLAVLTLLARPGATTGIVIAIGALLLTAAGIGMIGLGFHYFTDIVGGTFFAVAVVFALRLAISRLSTHPSREQSTG